MGIASSSRSLSGLRHVGSALGRRAHHSTATAGADDAADAAFEVRQHHAHPGTSQSEAGTDPRTFLGDVVLRVLTQPEGFQDS